MPRFVTCIVGVFFATVSATNTDGPKYRIIDLGQFPGYEDKTGLSANAFAMNNLTQIVGEADGCGGTRAFLWQDGVMRDITGGDCSVQGSASAINNRGQITLVVGGHSYFWNEGSFTPLGSLGYGDVYPYAINKLGQVVGIGYSSASDRGRAFLWDNGTLRDLQLTTNGYSSATDINDAGQIVGVISDPNFPTFGFLWDNGTAIPLSSDTYVTVAPYAINGHGQVAADGGVDVEGTDINRGTAIIWQNGNTVDVGALSVYPLSISIDINESGQFLGEGYLDPPFNSPIYPFIYDDDFGVRGFFEVLLPWNTPWIYLRPHAINDFGQIVGVGVVNHAPAYSAFLMTPIFADFNENDQTDIDDFSSLQACLQGPAGGRSQECLLADLNRSRAVDLLDFWMFQNWFESE